MSESIIPINRMKQALQNGQSLIGTMVAEIRQPAVMQLLVNAGFDFVIIDNEHGPFSIETIADLSRAARQLGLTPLVRVPDLAYPYLAQSLDAGAQGIMLPRVFDAGQVRQAVQMIKYPPVGIRGCALSRGFTDFKAGPLAENMASANEQTALIVQIETQMAVENIEEIVATPGVDIALIGPTDLSIALGVAGQMDSPKLHSAIEKLIETCQRHGVYPALHINDLQWAGYWAKKGMRLLSSNSETGLLIRGGLEVTGKIKEAFGR
jgi:2-keto-3-deoxy-L-rhamnonate aldolase RhmA